MLKPILFAGLATAMLSGCGTITPGGIIAAQRLDPLKTPPRDITVAINVPHALRLQDGDAVFRLAFVPEGPDAPPAVETRVPLSVLDVPGGPAPDADGESVYVLGFAAEDAARVAAAQDRITTLREQEVPGAGSLSVLVAGGCFTDDLESALPVSTWLRTSPDAGFVRLTRRVDMFDVLPPEDRAQLQAALQPC